MADVQIICIQSRAFDVLLDRCLDRINEKFGLTEPDWLSADEVMELLHIKSRTTLKNLVDTGQLKYSHPLPRLIVYSRSSALEFLARNSHETF